MIDIVIAVSHNKKNPQTAYAPIGYWLVAIYSGPRTGRAALCKPAISGLSKRKSGQGANQLPRLRRTQCAKKGGRALTLAYNRIPESWHRLWHRVIRDWVPKAATGRDGEARKPKQIKPCDHAMGWTGTPAALYKTAALPLS
jgi:hypothetical protein